MKNNHMIFHLGCLAGQAGFKTFFQKGNQVNGENEEDQKHPDKLHKDNVNDHQRMAPGRIGAVAGGG